MAGLNKVMIIGNVGQDPETRYMPNGDAVTNITVATSETWKDKNTGEKKEKTEWHRITFYRKQAETIQQYVKKGSRLYVEGRLQTRSWEQDGIKRYATDIIAKDFQFLSSKTDGQQSPQQQNSQPRQEHKQPEPQYQQDDFDDDIPF